MAEQTQKLSFIIDAENKADKAFQDVEKGIGGLQGKLKDMSPAFKTMAVAGTAAFGALSAVVYDSLKASAEAAEVQAQLNSVIKSTGGAAGLTADEILNMSKALQKQTTFGDEAITSASNMLLTFTNIKKDVFPDAIKTVLDMSTALGQDLKSSSVQLGKALQDPILGVSALRRVGVNFTEDQQEMIKTMVESGKTMEAQKFILNELATEFGGSAAAQAQTFSGRMKQLNEQVGDMKEAIGNALVPILTDLLNKIAPIIEKMVAWAEQNPETVKTILIVGGAIAGIVAVLGTLGLVLPAIIGGIQAVGAALLFLAANPIGAVISAIGLLIIGGIALYKNWDKVKQYLKDTWDGIKLIVKTNVEWIMAKLQPMIDAIKWVIDNVKKVGGAIGDKVSGAVSSVKDFLGVGNNGKPADLTPLSTVNTTGIGSQFNFNFNGDVNDPEKLKNSIIGALNRQSTLSLVGGR